MSTASFPTLPGLGWSVTRTPIWQTRQQDSVSGKRLNLADWSYPKHKWGLTYNFLRGAAPTYQELQTLEGFFSARQGSYDSFLYNDPRDNSVTGSTIGIGDSTDRTWQLSRYYGSTVAGYSEPILGPIAVSQLKVGASVITSTQYFLDLWGTTAPGLVTFSTFAPSTGLSIVADFTYSWPASFDDDQLDFEEFVKQIWQLKTLSFTSLK